MEAARASRRRDDMRWIIAMEEGEGFTFQGFTFQDFTFHDEPNERPKQLWSDSSQIAQITQSHNRIMRDSADAAGYVRSEARFSRRHATHAHVRRAARVECRLANHADGLGEPAARPGEFELC